MHLANCSGCFATAGDVTPDEVGQLQCKRCWYRHARQRINSDPGIWPQTTHQLSCHWSFALYKVKYWASLCMVQLCGRCNSQKAALRRPKTFDQVCSSCAHLRDAFQCEVRAINGVVERHSLARRLYLHVVQFKSLSLSYCCCICSSVELASMKYSRTKCTRQSLPIDFSRLEKRWLLEHQVCSPLIQRSSKAALRIQAKLLT